jgi:hypothetical protein
VTIYPAALFVAGYESAYGDYKTKCYGREAYRQ